MSETMIRVENLGKKYVIAHQQKENYTTLRDTLANGAKNLLKPFQNSKSQIQNPAQEEFWALKDVSFEIKRGDRVGIIGHNGAGKSTLLKILSRITEPTTGRIQIKGRVASLLEVGTGFHPELTGRENIFLNGAILGMSNLEIKHKFNEIVEFAEIEKFLDTPVKRYSSGMYVRLAFAVAAHLEPDILIVDEVLAVGDMQFQKKCIGKMEDVGRQGRTVLFVSHNIGVLQTLCERGILLRRGTVIADNTSSKTVGIYLETLEQLACNNLLNRTDRRGKGKVRLAKVEISVGDKVASTVLSTGNPARFIFHLTDAQPDISCSFTLYDHHGQPIAHFNSATNTREKLDTVNGKCQLSCEIDELLLVPGRYRMNVAITSNKELQDHIEAAAIVEVKPGHLRGYSVTAGSNYGSVCLPHYWRLAV